MLDHIRFKKVNNEEFNDRFSSPNFLGDKTVKSDTCGKCGARGGEERPVQGFGVST